LTLQFSGLQRRRKSTQAKQKYQVLDLNFNRLNGGSVQKHYFAEGGAPFEAEAVL
jgi:hypothetical protein